MLDMKEVGSNQIRPDLPDVTTQASESKRIAQLDVDITQLGIKRVVLVPILQAVIEHDQALLPGGGNPYQPRIEADHFRYIIVLNQVDPVQCRREVDFGSQASEPRDEVTLRKFDIIPVVGCRDRKIL